MDGKHHWAWKHFADGGLKKAQLKVHFQQEYAVYVRDFPVFLARIHGQNPPPAVRRMLAENIFEEDTGGLSLGKSHPELFLAMMKGLGFAKENFQHVRPLPAAQAYRAWLDKMSHNPRWPIGTAVLTIFVEGSVNDRHEILKPSKPKSAEHIERIVKNHPLVRHHGLSIKHMDLIRAHQLVEAGHRHDAYEMVVNYTPATLRPAILDHLKKSLSLWLRYRDAVAQACGIMKV